MNFKAKKIEFINKRNNENASGRKPCEKVKKTLSKFQGHECQENLT